MTAATVTTTTGAVRGSVDRGVRRYLGIPYAAAPFGEARFALPRPHPPWPGVRDATRFGPTAPQAGYPGGLARVLPSVRIPGEEILNLNIWAPAAPAGGAGHPVMVWLHGGGLTRGATAIGSYDGHAFARDAVVLVSVGYRLGAEGFSVLDGAPVNLGLADQLAALGWVRENIAGFGGDPARVTGFGHSAGGACVAALLARPGAAAPFSRAIIQSGPLGGAVPPDRARRVTELMARDLGVAPTRVGFAAVPPDRLVASQTRVTGGGSPLAGGPGFAPVIGDDLVPADPAAALMAGAGAAVPLLLGHTTEEYRLWFAPTGLLDRIGRRHLLAARLRGGIPGRAVRRYRRSRPGARPAEILGALLTDRLLRVPMNDLADARARHGGRSWLYEFGWRSPVYDFGAAHGLELGFVFDTLDRPDAAALAGSDPPQCLADRMHAAWVRFAGSGDPGWPAWNPRRPVMTFDAPGGRVVEAPREDERRVLSRRTG